MRDEFKHYATGQVDDFLDFLDNPDVLYQDREDFLVKISEKGWDECLEILVGRDAPILKTLSGRQAWVNMAGNGYTDCWMQLAPIFLNAAGEDKALWRDALNVCLEEAHYSKSWEVYALAKMLAQMPAPDKGATDTRILALTGLRIGLMHGMDAQSATKELAEMFAAKALREGVKTAENVFEGLSWG